MAPASKEVDMNSAIAQQWHDVANALELAAAAWAAVSPDSAGPVQELLHNARWNACVFQQLAEGVARPLAWQRANTEVGTLHRPSHILYDPVDSDSES